ncbi:hypothetical protein HYU13_00960 [Candidatus Woesearchaeota archaeon]|nr:hypothetical protein [Candidatus Woesearchaeota archaeon]
MGNDDKLFLELLTGETDQVAVDLVDGLFVQYPNGVPLEAVRETLLKHLEYDPSKIVNSRQIPEQQAKNMGVVYFPTKGRGSEMKVCHSGMIFR